MSQELSLSQLRLVLNRLLDALVERRGDDRVPLTAEHYWVIEPRATYDMTAEPVSRQMTVGQLSDDLQRLSELATSADPPVLWHDLAHVIGILQRLAAQDLS